MRKFGCHNIVHCTANTMYACTSKLPYKCISMLSSLIYNTSFTTEMLIKDDASSYIQVLCTENNQAVRAKILYLDSISKNISVSKNYQEMALIFPRATPEGNLHDLGFVSNTL